MALGNLASVAMAAESTVGTLADNDYANWTGIRGAEVTGVTLQQPAIQQGAQTLSIGSWCKAKVGPKRATVTIRTPCIPASETGTSGDPAVIGGDVSLLFAFAGWNETIREGTTINSGLSTDNDLDVADESKIPVGSVVMVNGEPRIVLTTATNEATITPDLSAAPSNTDVVYGGVEYTQRNAVTTNSVVVKMDGDYVVLLGAAARLVGIVESDAEGAYPMFEWEIQSADWDYNTGEPASGSFPEADCVTPLDGTGIQFIWDADGGETKTSRTAFDPGFQLLPELSQSAAEGISDWEVEQPAGQRSVVSANVFQASFASLYSNRESLSERPLILRYGSTTAGWVSLAIRNAQCVTIDRQIGDGIVEASVEFQANKTGNSSIYPVIIAMHGPTA